MITFNELLERAKSEKIAVHTRTEDEAKALLKALDEKGYVWNSGYKITDGTYYGVAKENTCYVIKPSDILIFNAVSFGRLQFCQEYDYTIIEFADIDFQEDNMITFTELLKRAETEEIVIHTPTEEQAKTLLKTLNEKGFMWAGGERLPDITYYEDFGQDTCYVFGCYNLMDSSKKVRYCALDFYQDHGYAITECGDIEWEN